MGMVIDGTIEDLANGEVSICFGFEPKGTKKTINQIFEERHTADPNLRRLMQQEADKMANQRHILIERDGTKYVFSKDAQGAYSWQPATKRDKLKYYIRNLL